ncbi:MAG: hypothetical protein BGO10_01075 [Chlamydia sp. 32-24]|nr:MAG: hypothetical protein BGO10_01075 [Chlamydia sp. 32-24]
MLLLSVNAGEQEWSKRIEIACQKLNLRCKVVFCPEQINEFEKTYLFHLVSSISAQEIANEFKPDFTVSLSDRCQVVHLNGVKNYLAISGSTKKVFDVAFSEKNKFLHFDGLLFASPLQNSISSFVKENKTNVPVINWYPSYPLTPYKPTIPKKLFYCGFQWDKKRNGQEYKNMFSILDEKGYFAVYGPEDRWECAKNSRKGSLPFDGVSVVKAIQEAGIALVLHAQSHMDLGAPTARIFEAAAACSIIISDENPFIKKEFKDNVLYVNGEANAEELAEQIDKHVNWIFKNKEKAQEMAKNAHAIFCEKFTLEIQIKNLINMNQLSTK